MGLLLAAALPSGPSGAEQPNRVYGLELEARAPRDRLLVFAEAPVSYELLESDDETLILAIPGAVLDPTAPRRIEPPGDGPLTRITAFDRADIDSPEVRVVIRRPAGLTPHVSQRGSILALDFPRSGEAERGVALQFRDADISDVVRKVGAATGQRFLFDERLRGRVTLIVPERVLHREALELLHATLLVRGFAALPTPGGALKVLPIEGTPEGARFELDPGARPSDAPITTLVRLESADAQEIAAQLAPWIGASAQVQGYAPTNSLILAGSENRLQTLLALARALDQAAEERVFVRRLRHADADQVAATLEEMYDRPGVAHRQLVFTPDERSNALVVRVPAELGDEVRARIDRLDQPVLGGGRVAVIPLRYVDPEDFEALLRELVAGDASISREAARTGAQELRGREISMAVDPASHSLVARGDPQSLQVLYEVIDKLDRAPPRVSVEAMVLEITTDGSLRLGFDAFIPINEPSSASDVMGGITLNPGGGGLFQPGSQGGPSGAARLARSPLILPIVDENGNPLTPLQIPRESFVITADEREVSARILLRPTLLVASGEEQEIFAGNNIPIPVSGTEQANPLQTRQNIQRQDIGVTLRVRPTVGEAGDVQLQLRLESASLAPSAAGDAEFVGPTIQQRTVETTVQVADDEWVVIGMGHDPEFSDVVVGTPFFKDIPVLGNLFRTTVKREMQNQLVVAVQGRIQRTRDERLADAIRQRLGFERAVTRTEGLDPAADGPVALRITTRPSQAQANAVADTFRSGSHPVRVVRWQAQSGERFDVLLTGFSSVVDAAAAARPLAAEGWSAQIVVLPRSQPEPFRLHARPKDPPTPPF